MPFTTITQDDKDLNTAKHIIGREQELYHYQINIDNYETTLTTLNLVAWPENLVQYKNLDRKRVATEVPNEDLQEVSDLLHAEELIMRLKTEKIEQGKTQHAYNALITQLQTRLTDVEITALLATAKAALASEV